MKVEHIAIWVEDIEKMKAFYQKYFNVGSTELYHNQKTDFRSYFLTFEEGSRIELTTKQHLSNRVADSLGYSHIALAVGDKNAVDNFAERFVKDGYPLLNGPRTTGDGYYEAVIQDPEGNLIELTTN
ncbi:VOC family protein [Tetragenococcus halophilus]|uniref:VOC family protein n=1 Tax=Tetragenococcus halophilus TaxID=51669 RepID=UPI00209AA0D8|nr:VOC family protein [Tetragenococcus halophilus]MCO8289188.1 VOC family protein [Tetragenococcus halophilus]MDN6711223.1 VOC family protein [Tetragenococcus halophilus]MDN6723748.1 VOC family protein [Tetragenococcus halophilus]